MPEITEWETDRLLLRQWRLGDEGPFAALNGDPAVMGYFPEVLTREESDAMARKCKALIKARGWGLWAVETKADGRFIGFVGLHVPAAALPFCPCVEIGWRLAAPAWGNGYATEGAKAALWIAFEELRLEEVVSFTAQQNRRSRAVMERIGMARDRRTFEHPEIPEGNPLRTHVLYRIGREKWERSLRYPSGNSGNGPVVEP